MPVQPIDDLVAECKAAEPEVNLEVLYRLGEQDILTLRRIHQFGGHDLLSNALRVFAENNHGLLPRYRLMQDPTLCL